MCIAIYQPSNKVLTEEVLKTCFLNNGDGCGFSYINVDHRDVRRLVVKKSMDFESFYHQYKRAVRVAPESPFLIHFRIKTHGEISTFNCHPFVIDKDHVFIHNGIISGVPRDPVKSDTQMFNEKCLKHLPTGWTENLGIKMLIEDAIGYSKIVTLDRAGEVSIFNEHKGEWHEEVWFSNSSYKPRVYKPAATGTAANGTYNYGRAIDTLDYDDYSYGRGYTGSRTQWTPKDRTEDTETVVDQLEAIDETTCDTCGNFETISELVVFLDSQTCYPRSLCMKCFKKIAVYKPHTHITIDCFLDYLNSDDTGEYGTVEYSLDQWENPWGLIVREDSLPAAGTVITGWDYVM